MDSFQELQTVFQKVEYSDDEGYWNKCEESYDNCSGIIKTKSFEFSNVDQQKEIKNEIDEDATILSSSIRSNEIIEFNSSEESLTHPCLKKISISDSQLKLLNIYNFYPVPKDPGLSLAFWLLYPRQPPFKSNGIDKFFKITKQLKLAPIQSLRQQLKSNKIVLKYYTVDSEIIEALSEALFFNRTVKTLNLQDNLLKPDACFHLSRLLMQNNVLRILILTGCKIGKDGAIYLEEGIGSSTSLKELNLSRCDLGNKGFSYIAKGIIANNSLENLNVCGNNLSQACGVWLQKVLQHSEIKIFDLSWNDLNTKEVIDNILQGLKQNNSLNHLNLSWNSMGRSVLSGLSLLISKTENIKSLNLSANLFTEKEAVPLAKALINNTSLDKFYLSQNPLRPKGASDFIQILSSPKFLDCPLSLLDLESLWVDKYVIPTLDELKFNKPKLIIKISGILENFESNEPDLKELFFLSANFEAMNPKKKRDQKDFSLFVLRLGNSIIQKSDFKTMLTDDKIKISENLTKMLMTEFEVTKKTIDLAALKTSYKSYFPNAKLPEPKHNSLVDDITKSKKNKNKRSCSKKQAKKKY